MGLYVSDNFNLCLISCLLPHCWVGFLFFFFQAEDGIRDRSPSRGLGDVYKRQARPSRWPPRPRWLPPARPCLLYTSDAADDLLCVDLGGRRIIKKKKKKQKQ